MNKTDELKEEQPFWINKGIDKSYTDDDFFNERASKYIVLSGERYIDRVAIMVLDYQRQLLLKGLDISKISFYK